MPDKNVVNIMLLGLYSPSYPMSCESHALSILAGNIVARLEISFHIEVIDLYMHNGKQNDFSVLNKISSFMPDVLGISVPYGSIEVLNRIYPDIKNILKQKKHHIVFGGAIPTYLPDLFLNHYDPDSIVVIGEGDEVLPSLISSLINGNNLQAIYNICYMTKTGIVYNLRKLADTSKSPAPYRSHLGKIVKKDTQVILETSRGCTWSRCSFCPRGIVDIADTKSNFRYFPLRSIEDDLIYLFNIGVRNICFADEDFLGKDCHNNDELLFLLLSLRERGYIFSYHVSMNVNSVYSSKWPAQKQDKRILLLSRLFYAGVGKIFLGIESGVLTQLKRYSKNHTPEEGVTAISILESLGFEVEMGFILFDPLCTISEIKQNLFYLTNNNIAKYVSSLGSGLELRLHFKSLYYEKLKRLEINNKFKLSGDILDTNTLTFSSKYRHSDVELLVHFTRQINMSFRNAYYILKNMTRFTCGDIEHSVISALDSKIILFRELYINFLFRTITNNENNISNEDNTREFNKSLINILLTIKNVLLSNVDEGNDTTTHQLLRCIDEIITSNILETPQNTYDNANFFSRCINE